MKKIKIVLAALVLTAFGSCQDAIDIVQPGELTPEATFKTVADLQKGLIGAYGAMSTINEISFSSVWTDEVRLGFNNGGQGISDGRYSLKLTTNSSDAYNIWLSNYALINSANRVIDASTRIPVVSGSNEELQVNDIVAQAKILRAWGHFRLLSYFSTDLTNDNALGVILVDHVPATNEHLPRSTNGKVFEFIEEDLTFAVNNLLSNATNSNNFILSPDFITAFRARMNSYRDKHDAALSYANTVINSGRYTLATGLDYSDLWKDIYTSGLEVIFRLDRVNGDAKIGSTWASIDATLAGSPFYAVSSDLFNLLNNQEDIRLSSFISSTSDFSDPAKGKIVISKYPGTGNYALLNDEKVFRLSEMYFIKAEAYLGKGNVLEAYKALNTVIEARFTEFNAPLLDLNNLPTDIKVAYRELLKQRRIELCYEGHRYLDLKRLGAPSKGNVGIDRNSADCTGDNCSLPAGSPYFTMPIPTREIQNNPVLRNQAGGQNPGY